MVPFTEHVQMLLSESERIKHYFHALSAEALTQASACSQWQVQDVIAHLIGVAETYASSITRGLKGDTGPLAGRPPAGQGSGAASAESIAQRSIAARQSLGEHLLSTYDVANDHLNHLISNLQPQERTIACYHPGGMVPAENFIDLRLKELAVHEWDIRAGLEAEAHLSPASMAALMTVISESIASGSLRWAFWGGPQLPRPVRYRFVVSGQGPSKSDIVVAGDGLRMDEAGSHLADVTFRCDVETYVLFVYGRLDQQAALASGRLVAAGEGDLALAFGQWFRGI